MRRIERTGQLRRDYKREARGQHRASLDADLVSILITLADDQPLAPRHHAHALSGDWKDHRDCHVKPDLVLIYQKPRRRHATACSPRVTFGTRALTSPVVQGMRRVDQRLDSRRDGIVQQRWLEEAGEGELIGPDKVCYHPLYHRGSDPFPIRPSARLPGSRSHPLQLL